MGLLMGPIWVVVKILVPLLGTLTNRCRIILLGGSGDLVSR